VVPAFVRDIGYSGYFYHKVSGLDFTRHRAYDPVHARWLNRDSVAEAGGVNLCAYVGGNPISHTDPTGQCPWCAVVGAVIGGAAGGLTAYLEGGSASDVAYATGSGALSGAVAGLTLGAAGTVAVGAVAGASEVAAAAYGGVYSAAAQGIADWTTWANSQMKPPSSCTP
jgi:RHS repeat-associated protein